MSESSLLRALRIALWDWDPRRIETNATCPGFPDVSHAYGLIETKQVDEWPVRDETVLRLKYYTETQRAFHRERWAAGGQSHVLLQVDADFLLFRPGGTDIVGEVNKDWLFRIAIGHWRKKLHPEELKSCLRKRTS